MRSAGFVLAALLIAASVGLAQPPAVPGSPVPGQPVPPPAPPAPAAKSDPRLDGHLAEWEKKMRGVTNVRTEISLKRTDVVFKKATNYTGVVLCMKPNYAILRLDNAAEKIDYEAYICDGKSLYVYNGVQKTVTEIKLAKSQAAADNLMLEFLSGMTQKEVKQRFDISLFKTDENYIYLDIKPLRPSDQREFKQLRLALYGPGPLTAKVAYLPAQVFMLKPNDDTEMWTFTNSKIDIPGVDAKVFKFVPIQEKGWKYQQAPLQPVGGPVGGPVPAGGPALPGAVRPNH